MCWTSFPWFLTFYAAVFSTRSRDRAGRLHYKSFLHAQNFGFRIPPFLILLCWQSSAIPKTQSWRSSKLISYSQCSKRLLYSTKVPFIARFRNNQNFRSTYMAWPIRGPEANCIVSFVTGWKHSLQFRRGREFALEQLLLLRDVRQLIVIWPLGSALTNIRRDMSYPQRRV